MKLSLEVKGLKVVAENAEKRFAFEIENVAYSEELADELKTTLDSVKDFVIDLVEKVDKIEDRKEVQKTAKENKDLNELNKLYNESLAIANDSEASYDSVSRLSNIKFKANNILIAIKYSSIDPDKNILNEAEDIIRKIQNLYDNKVDDWMNINA